MTSYIDFSQYSKKSLNTSLSKLLLKQKYHKLYYFSNLSKNCYLQKINIESEIDSKSTEQKILSGIYLLPSQTSKIQDMRQDNFEQDRKQQAGRWTKEQHQRFMYAIVQYGKDWKKVEQYVKTRTGSQVRSHAQKFFNKLEKVNPTQQGQQRNQQQHSQTQFDMEKEVNNEFTPTTPLELVSLIKKQAKDTGGKVSLNQLKQKLKQTEEMANKQKERQIQMGQRKPNSFKSMSNILSAYEGIKQQNQETFNGDESFLILITKRYKKYLNQTQDFGKLIDIKNAPIEPNSESVVRKRSFTLPEGRDLSSDQAQQKIEEIKRQINTQNKQKRKHSGQKYDQKQRKVEKDCQKEINFTSSLNRLATIQQQVKEEEQFNSFAAIPHIESTKEDVQASKNKK